MKSQQLHTPMRNLRREAETVLATSRAVLPEEIHQAARSYAEHQKLSWWETAFLTDELEKLTGVSLTRWRYRRR